MRGRNKIVKCVQNGKYYPSMIAAAKEVLHHKKATAVWESLTYGKPCRGFQFVEVPYTAKFEKLDKDDSLCWICQNTHREFCPWFDPDNQQPVEGWEIKKVDLNTGKNTEGYIVKKCPNFKKEDWYMWEV